MPANGIDQANSEEAPAVPCTTPEQKLWQTVLLTLLRDILTDSFSRDSDLHRRQAQAWVGSHPSRNFIEVCEMAGFPVSTTHARFRKLVSASASERAKVMESLTTVRDVTEGALN